MKPSEKSPQMEEALKNLFGFDRRDSIEDLVCIPPPIGCGKPFDLKNATEIEIKEFRISGLCSTCQREIFGGG